ncbi:MAG TPA: nucleotidyltransferase domain-containing protein [Kofleriaceae bacterium]|jgi:predicted nucleotidyltransferase
MIDDVVAEMRRAHGAHAVILYGSHARGDATAESDVDVAAFADVSRVMRDARPWRGSYLDGFVYPTATEPEPDLLKLVGGTILLDERGTARALLDRLDELERRGPIPLPDDEARMRRVWFEKTLARIRRGDPEAHYRRHQLLVNLLEDYFALRGVWFRGAKVALAELAQSSPDVFDAFVHAMAPGAPIDAVARLVAIVIG